MSALRSLLEKLDPESMMKDGGLQKATLAIGLLEKKSADAGFAEEVAAAGGVQILVQTAVLHPAPTLRQSATSVLVACVKQRDPAFLKSALERRLPEALLRLMREDARRVKAAQGIDQVADGDSATDPDLPTRRIALSGLEALLSLDDPFVLTAIFQLPTSGSVLIELPGNTDPDIRQRAPALLSMVVASETGVAAIEKTVEDDPVAAATQLLGAACDSDSAISATIARVILSLRASESLRVELRKLGAVERLEGEARDLDEGIRASLITWLESDTPFVSEK